MAIVINADSKTVVIFDRDDTVDSRALSLLVAKGTARPAPRNEFAAMRQVESEVYQTQP
jgi:hypothetical protein